MSETNQRRPRTGWIKIILFCTLFACVFLAVQHVLNYKNTLSQYWPGRLKTYGQLPAGTIDVVVIGASVNDHSFSPNILWNETGITVYNMSGAIHSHVFNEQKLLTMLEMNAAPKYAVFTPNSLFNGVRYTTEVITAYRKVWSALPTLSQKVRALRALEDDMRAYGREPDTLSFVLPLLYSHARWTQVKRWEIPPAWWFADEDPPYMLGQSHYPKARDITDGVAEGRDSGEMELDATAVEGWTRIFAVCRENGIQPVVCLLPRFDGTPSAVQKELALAFFEQNNVLVFDYSSEEELERMAWDYTAEFNDLSHINFGGAIRFSVDFAHKLAQLPGLEDHRGDPAYAVWDGYRDEYYAAHHDELVRVLGEDGALPYEQRTDVPQ